MTKKVCAIKKIIKTTASQSEVLKVIHVTTLVKQTEELCLATV